MTKLKCWRKVPSSKSFQAFQVEWKNQGSGERVIIDKNVHYSDDFKWTGHSLKKNKNVSDRIFLNVEKKSDAVAEANKYMKSHDKC